MMTTRFSTATATRWLLFAPLVFGLAATPVLAASPAPAGAPTPATAPAPGRTTAGPGASGGSGAAGAAVAPVVLPPPRPVDALLADVVAAVGGAAALGRHRSMHTKMEITFKGLGITGSAEHYGMVGDKSLTITSIPSVASTREGSDGTRFWSEDPINGLRVLEGTEADQARLEAVWNAELRMKDLFPKIEARNELAEDGARLECLILTPKIGQAMTECFDGRTHLMTLQRGVRSGPQGDMPFTAKLSDWRTVGDVKLAHATEMQVGPLAFSGRVTSVELDVAMDATMFAVPTPPSAPKTQKTPQRAQQKTQTAQKAGVDTAKGKPARSEKKAPGTTPSH